MFYERDARIWNAWYIIMQFDRVKKRLYILRDFCNKIASYDNDFARWKLSLVFMILAGPQ
jgi:hypothetical protein